MNIEINGLQVKTEADFHSQLADALGVRRFYGANLDALWDLLSAGVERPLLLSWSHSMTSRKNLGITFDRIVSVLAKVKEQDAKFGWVDEFDFSLL
jgi:ribonuclease inhibitor